MADHEYARNINLKDGVKVYLNQLMAQGIKMGIATATDRRLTEAVLTRHGILSLFQAIVTIGEIGVSKDEPAIFLSLAEKLGVNPGECVVFEDSLHAVKGAKKAGMKAWAVYDRFSECERPQLEAIADRYFLDFNELLEGEHQ